MVLEETLESPLASREIQPVHSEGVQPWDVFGRNDAKAETPVLWPIDLSLLLFVEGTVQTGRKVSSGLKGNFYF